MTQDEQRQFEQLREQLEIANRDAEQSRLYLASELSKSDGEVRFYRGLIWTFLALGAITTVVCLLQ